MQFVGFHNNTHRYTCLQGKTPERVFKESRLSSLKIAADFQLAEKIPLEGGTILFIFFVRSDCTIDVLGTKIKINPILQYSYITARLNIDTHTLTIVRDHEVFHLFPFNMPTDW